MQAAKAIIWTCAMHPQIRLSAAGKCPICGTELIPLNHDNITIDPDAIHLTKDAAQLANVQTLVVARQNPIKEIRLYGKVQADERLLQSQVAHIPGRIEKLLVNSRAKEFEKARHGRLFIHLQLVLHSRNCLRHLRQNKHNLKFTKLQKKNSAQWKLRISNCRYIESSDTIQNNFEVTSTTTGIITARRVKNG